LNRSQLIDEVAKSSLANKSKMAMTGVIYHRPSAL